MKFANNFSLTFTWAGFVFLYINFLVGVSLSDLNFTEFLLSNIMAFILYLLGMYPSVYLSFKYKLNFAEAIKKFLTRFSTIIYVLILFINIGWYAIQLEMIWEIFDNIYYVFIFSYLFAYGSYRWGFEYLKFFSYISISTFLFYVLYSVDIDFKILDYSTVSIDIETIFKSSMVIFGSWAFSSTTLIMDVAKFGNSFKNTFIQLIFGLILGDFLLIFLGYIYANTYNIDNFNEFLNVFGVFVGSFILILNIWSTNDSNFYNSINILKQLNVSKKTTFLLLPFISVLLVYFFGKDLFSIIGNWLIVMSNVGLVMILVWWYIYIKEKRDEYRGLF